MHPFELVEPRSLTEAVAELNRGDPDVRVTAGGTALVVLMKEGLLRPRRLVSLRRIRGLDGIELRLDGSLWVGATACHEAVHRHGAVGERFPVLAQAAGQTANVRIRNVGTLGGNLAHADHQSDPPTALLALDAAVHLQGPAGVRVVPVGEFLRGPYTTDLAEGEVVVGVHVPPPPEGARMTYLKFAPGTAGDRPLLNVAAVVQREDGACRGARLSVGAVSGRPVRLAEVEAFLAGKVLTDSLIDQAGDAAAELVEPLADLNGSVWYKRQMTRVFVRRALRRLRADDE